MRSAPGVTPAAFIAGAGFGLPFGLSDSMHASRWAAWRDETSLFLFLCTVAGAVAVGALLHVFLKIAGTPEGQTLSPEVFSAMGI